MGSKATPVAIARVLAREAGSCGFRAPVAHVYNPLDCAFDAHRQYLERHCRREADILLVGMNPGPWGPQPEPTYHPVEPPEGRRLAGRLSRCHTPSRNSKFK